MRSMTGYRRGGRGERPPWGVGEPEGGATTGFSTSSCGPGDELRTSEGAVRDLLAQEISRGRVEARVEAAAGSASGGPTVQCTWGSCGRRTPATHQLVSEGLVATGLAAGDLLRIPEAFRVEIRGGGVGRGGRRRSSLRVTREAAGPARGRPRDARGPSLAAVLDEQLRALDEVVARLDALRGPVRDEIAAGAAPAPRRAPRRPCRSTRPASPRRWRSWSTGATSARRSTACAPTSSTSGACSRETGPERQAPRLPDPGDLPRAQHPGRQVPQRRDDPRRPRRQGPLRAAPRAGAERGVGCATIRASGHPRIPLEPSCIAASCSSSPPRRAPARRPSSRAS